MKYTRLFLVALFFISSTAFAQHPLNVIKESVWIPMRDGVRLGATLYRPDQPGKFPAIVYRTPYSKDAYDKNSELPLKAAKSGYLVFLIDVRGRYTSEGSFRAYHQEKADGYDVIESVARSEHCDGNVGTYGRSYPGYVQWLALSQAPPSLKTAIPEMTPIHSHQFFYVGGAFSYAWFDWFVPLILPDLRRRAADTSGPWDVDSAYDEWQKDKRKWYAFRPLGENPLLKKYAPYYYDWLTHPERTDFWEFANVEQDFSKIQAPLLLVSGWFDNAYGVLGATDAFRRMRTEAGSSKAREETRLILGPWNHGPIHVKRTSFGSMEHAPSGGMDYDAHWLEWFDRHLKQKPLPAVPPVSIYVMGAGWRYEKEWPLSRAKQASYYLRSNGSLKLEPPRTEKPDSYVFDPGNPFWDPANEQSYPYDQRETEARKDVITYTSDVLTEDAEVTGRIVAELFVSSSAMDTDFAMTLCDVDPDGASINLASLDSGYLRMRYRNGFQKQELMNPGEVYKIRIDNLYTSNLFRKGHRIRLQITSSRLPHYDPNTNTGTNLATETNLVAATQTIYHDAQHPSRVILPFVAPASQ
jgi:hypothetical protein